MKRLKVLMLTRLFPSQAFPSFGTFCLERAKALSAHADVRVMVPTPYYPPWLPGKPEWKKWTLVEHDGIVPQCIQVTYPRYGSIPGTATWFQGVAMAHSVRRELTSLYGGWQPDVVDAHFAFPDGYAGVKLAQAIGVPSVVTCHGSDLRQYPAIPIAGGMTRWTLRHADRVISVSTDLLRRSTELGCPTGRTVFLTNGVDPDKFTVRNKADCRQQLGLPLNRKIAVQVAALVDVKDQSLGLHALADIRKKGQTPPLLVLVGDGPNRQRLQNEITQLGLTQDVILAGQRPHAEVAVWMGAADWLLLTSSSEGWPTVYFEAMACGRPVITSNVSSAKDAICQSAYGTVVEPRTPQAFAQAMLDAAQCDFAPSTLRAYAEGNSWQLWAQRAMSIFEAAAAAPKP
jgi:glycosyltransferase involved in cell wall biosynthesis